MRAGAAAAPPVISPDLAVISAAARSRGGTSCSGDIGEMYIAEMYGDIGKTLGDIGEI